MANHIQIHSENNHFQHVEVIKRNREKRTRYKKFFVEGVSAINLARENGWVFDTFIFEKGRKLSSWAKDLLEEVDAKTHLEMPTQLQKKLSDKEETSELLALIEMKNPTLSEIHPHKNGLVVVCDRPASPGNLGTSIRTADAFGADAIIVSGHAVDIYDPSVIRSSVGTFFVRPIIRVESHVEVVKWARDAEAQGMKYQIVGTSAVGESSLNEHRFGTDPVVLLIGNETNGLTRSYKEIADVLLKIPITGAASSLNVSTALAVALYEINRQRTT